MPRPKSRSSDEITAGAIAVLDRDGYAQLSMRNVAGEFDVSVMALYCYVSDREELEQWVVERLLSSLRVEVDSGLWTDQAFTLVGRVPSTAHPEAIPLLLRHRHDAPSSLRSIERMLDVLAEAGFEGTRRVVAQRSIVHFLVGSIQAQRLSSLPGTGTVSMAGLLERIPELGRACIARRVIPDEEFQRGLAGLLAGLRGERDASEAADYH